MVGLERKRQSGQWRLQGLPLQANVFLLELQQHMRHQLVPGDEAIPVKIYLKNCGLSRENF